MKRKPPRDEPELEGLLGPYSAESVPHSLHEGLRSLRCRRCKKMTLFDSRHPSSVCRWCSARLS